MKQRNTLRNLPILLAALTVVLILSLTVGSTMAYFTTYTMAKGGKTIAYTSAKTELEEEFKDWVKNIRIQNTGEVPCFVRARAYAGSDFDLYYSDAESGKWSAGGDGYWYYSDILQVGEKTDPLYIKIEKPEYVKVDFDVIVVHDCVPASYQADGTPYGDWTSGGRGE